MGNGKKMQEWKRKQSSCESALVQGSEEQWFPRKSELLGILRACLRLNLPYTHNQLVLPDSKVEEHGQF